MSIGVLLRGFIGDMMDFGDVILYTLFPSFMTIQACTAVQYTVLKVPIHTIQGVLATIGIAYILGS